VVKFTDRGERSERGNGDSGRLDLERLQRGDLLVVERIGIAHVDLQRQHLRGDARSHILCVGDQLVVAILLSLPGCLRIVTHKLQLFMWETEQVKGKGPSVQTPHQSKG